MKFLSLVLAGRPSEEYLLEFALMFEVCLGPFWESHCFCLEHRKEPQRSHESLGGSITPRSLICVGKQRDSIFVTTALGVGGGDGDGGMIF